jgi:hypothetical protein
VEQQDVTLCALRPPVSVATMYDEALLTGVHETVAPSVHASGAANGSSAAAGRVTTAATSAPHSEATSVAAGRKRRRDLLIRRWCRAASPEPTVRMVGTLSVRGGGSVNLRMQVASTRRRVTSRRRAALN